MDFKMPHVRALIPALVVVVSLEEQNKIKNPKKEEKSSPNEKILFPYWARVLDIHGLHY